MSLERRLRAFLLRFRSLFHRGQVETELDEELLFHIERLTESNIAKGMNPTEARYQARRAIEGYEQKKEECRDFRGVNWLENMLRDVRYGLRMLRRSPAFTAVAPQRRNWNTHGSWSAVEQCDLAGTPRRNEQRFGRHRHRGDRRSGRIANGCRPSLWHEAKRSRQSHRVYRCPSIRHGSGSHSSVAAREPRRSRHVASPGISFVAHALVRAASRFFSTSRVWTFWLSGGTKAERFPADFESERSE
jgi:hypothetical protein